MIDRLAYIAMTGAKNAMHQLGTTTHNLANAQTPGFREILSSYRAVSVRGAHSDSRAAVVDSNPGANFQLGSMISSESPLDIAIEGAGFFAVTRPNGAEAYTRAGKMATNQEGVLIAPSGHPYANANGGVITVPPDARRLTVLPDGTVTADISSEGVVTLGRIKMVDVDPHSLTRTGDGLFAHPLSPLDISDTPRVKQGVYEASNVNVAEAMVQMISQNRLFDLSLRMVEVAEQNSRSAGALVSLSRM